MGMTHEQRLARCAGLVYLIVVATGFFSLAYVPGKIAAPGNAQAVLDNIVSHDALFRVGMAAFLVEQAAFLLLPLMLFQLFRRVHLAAAVAMVALALPRVPLALAGVAHRLDALQLLTDTGGLPLQTAQAMARLSMKTYGNDIFIASLFWGLWLMPFGYLVFRSRMLPQMLGVLLMLGSAGYLDAVFGDLLVPGYSATPFSDYVHLPAALGEVGTCLWLLLMGVRSRHDPGRSGQPGLSDGEPRPVRASP